MTDSWDNPETTRALIAINLLNGEVSHREAMRMMMESGLDEADSAIWLADAGNERVSP